jgi:hypothetical protein
MDLNSAMIFSSRLGFVDVPVARAHAILASASRRDQASFA